MIAVQVLQSVVHLAGPTLSPGKSIRPTTTARHFESLYAPHQFSDRSS
jgi:hypothetical protein